MDTREQLLALHEELRRRKAEGVRSISVTDESLVRLRAGVSAQLAPAPQSLAATPAVAASAVESIAEPRPPFAPRPTPVRASAAPVFSLGPIPAEAPVVNLPDGDKQTRWDALQALVQQHPVCRQHLRPGKKLVLGVGRLDADIFFCGEAPGAEEEMLGEPFVGPAGQLLTRMIQGMGLKREQVYIGNIMNWRPEMATGPDHVQTGNRPPTPAELRFCLPFLRAQLDIVQPKLIVALGKTAAEGLLGHGSFRTLGEVRGRWHDWSGTPVMVTYHPAYILHRETKTAKREIWSDLLLVMERAGLPISEKQRGYYL